MDLSVILDTFVFGYNNKGTLSFVLILFQIQFLGGRVHNTAFG